MWKEFRANLKIFRRKIWNKGIKLWWYRLYIRKAKLHKSLSTDFEALTVMDSDERKSYLENLRIRREISDKRNLAKENTDLTQLILLENPEIIDSEPEVLDHDPEFQG